ncbi:MAG: hypothetical protein ABSA93_16510 [Streptosporangiaceae bacterium]
MRRRLTAAALAALGLLAIPASPGIARADSVVAETQLTNFHQILVDSADGYVFLSEGGTDLNMTTSEPGGLVVTNLAGAYVTTLYSGDGVEGLALDDGTLYVAVADETEIAAVDVATIKDPTPTETVYPLGSGDVPYSVAVQSGKIWVSYVPANAYQTTGNAAIGDINLSASSASSAFEADTAGSADWSAPPDLAADPDDDGALVAVLPEISAASAATFSTTTDPATVLTAQTYLGGFGTTATCAFESQVAFVPGTQGTEFITACKGPQTQEVWSTTNLTTPLRNYPTGEDPVGVAVAPDGTIAGGMSDPDQENPPVVYIYNPDGTLMNIIAIPSQEQDGIESFLDSNTQDVAWSADGSQLYLVTDEFNVDTGAMTYALRVLDSPEITRSTLTLSGASSIDLSKSISLTGKVTLSTGAVPAAGTAITITRSGVGAARTFTTTIGLNGEFSLTDTPTSAGTYTYSATYAGTATVAAATGSEVVQVIRAATSLTVAANGSTFNYEPTVTVTVHLGATYTNRVVSVYAQPFGSKSKTLIKSGKVNAAGRLVVDYRAPHSTTFSAVFAGDARYAPATVTRAVYVRASVSQKLTGYYGTDGKYLLYHSSSDLDVAGSVAPNKYRECVELELQEYYEGTWYDETSACGYLSKSSTISGRLTLSGADTGVPYRIRIDYLRGSDTSNLSNDSVWQYFMVES